MKHVKLFEGWHTTEVCKACKGTGRVGPSKKQSIENMIKNGTEKQFLDYIDDGDFVENAAELFKERGVYTLELAKLVAALNFTREQMQDIIKTTEKGIEGIEYALKLGSQGALPFHLKPEEKLIKIKNLIKNKAEILSILRGK
jgi:predicted DNA-binding protein YlxM (UPF0122 family)